MFSIINNNTSFILACIPHTDTFRHWPNITIIRKYNHFHYHKGEFQYHHNQYPQSSLSSSTILINSLPVTTLLQHISTGPKCTAHATLFNNNIWLK
jgi:hypothetical protein